MATMWQALGAEDNAVNKPLPNLKLNRIHLHILITLKGL